MARPSLNDLGAFVAVATHRSFRRAADELGTAPSTLSHAMRALEERMGVRLLNRTTRSVSPTEAGARLLEHLQGALASLDAALDSVADFRGRVTGTVRINAPRLAAAMLVRRVLPTMVERFPEVTVDLVAEGELVDIVSRGFDAGVRLVESIPKDMIAVPMSRPMRFACVASPAYLAQAGRPRTPDELARHRCIGHRMPSGKLYRWEFARGGESLTIDTAGPVVLDDEALMVDAAVEGLGIAYVPEPAAAADIAAGRLREVLAPWMTDAEAIAVYYPGHRAVPPALRAFLDVVREMSGAP
ncbi:DNA-binding transcriptional regulator, LysR family [Luteibacter sp. UNC138MFCol5.1]|uniref:LysR family transcriptional regulator n=1 Tax=Luteibacter sp. UNC138MFCol5.1 TaxID=1502774 RepID=UPI0008CFC2FD|nr:LysR family transcriptional regulator [Luteibacter sp. UNC138MFCol5.1]SEO92423.1 DNA-binding transcriptional regulator, LysR family [Luteibacter sp. UNC138MFCol5.1]